MVSGGALEEYDSDLEQAMVSGVVTNNPTKTSDFVTNPDKTAGKCK